MTDGEEDKSVGVVPTVEEKPGQPSVAPAEETEGEKPTDLETLTSDAEGQFGKVIGGISRLEEDITHDTTLSDKDRSELLAKAKKIKSSTTSWYRRFLRKVAETSHDLVRKPGKKWYSDHLLEKTKGESASLEDIERFFSTVTERLQHIEKKKLGYYHDREEVEATWISAWNHLVRASEDLLHLGEGDESEAVKALEEKNVEIAYVFWSRVFAQRMAGEGPSYIENLLITGNHFEFFEKMPKTLKQGFHKAFLEWLDRGFKKPYRRYKSEEEKDEREVNSADVYPFSKDVDVMHSYPGYLVRSFRLDDSLAVLGRVGPIHTEEELLGLDKDKKVYTSLGSQGLENEVANLAIHQAAFRTAGVATDGWHTGEETTLAGVSEKTSESLPDFLNNLYESLKDHPTALIQAFKGLLRIPTSYYHPAGAYEFYAGYHMYDKHGKRTTSFEPVWGSRYTFEEKAKRMKGFVFDISSSEDFRIFLEFVLEKGKINTHMNTLGAMFMGILGRAVATEESVSARAVDATLVSEDVEPLRRFNAVFPGDFFDGGKFLNRYLERFKRDKVDVLAEIDSKSLARLAEKVPTAVRLVFDFASEHCEQENAAEAINEHIRRIEAFVNIFGLFDAVCFETYSDQLDKGRDIFEYINHEMFDKISKDSICKMYFFDFIRDRGEQADAAEVIGEHLRQLCLFIDTVGFFHLHAFQIVISNPNEVTQSFVILEELPKGINYSVKCRILDNCETWIHLPVNKREAYYKVLNLVAETPSQEIQRIVNELSVVIMDSDDPVDSWRKIEDIFIKNNLPLVGKIYKIFQVLHPAVKIETTLASHPTLSPYLRKASPKRREYTIFSDLLKVHIESGNRSLRQYLEVLQEGEEFFRQFESATDRKLTVSEQRRLQSFLLKLNTVFAESQLGVVSSPLTVETEATVEQLRDIYSNLRRSLSVPDGRSMSDYVVETFASRLGYKNIAEVLEAMRTKKQNAHERGLNYAREAKGGRLVILSGDILKGTNLNYIPSILQNGSVAKEYLGASSSQDSTPYDTDVAVVGSVEEKSFFQVVNSSVASEYGDVIFVIRDRDQFVRTSAETTGQIDPSKLELFKTGVVGENHYGIRTGFPTTEIDFIVCKSVAETPKTLALEIVQNGYYIPVVDETGKIIFTPEQYKALRVFYSGLERFDGPAFPYSPTEETEPHYADVLTAKKGLVETREHVDHLTQEIQQVVAEVLQAQGIHLKDSWDTSIIGAELLDTGSTGRHTNLPGSFDFDLALRLDLVDESKFIQIASALREKLHPDKDNSHGGTSQSDLHQLRFEGAHLGDVSLDIDIAFVRKSELVVYGSHDAVKEKLDWIKENIGEEAQAEIIANIVVAKDVLKRGGAYKKLEHGGMGGIGVENWLLAHGGNFAQAARAFWQAAHDESGNLRSLASFQDHYEIVDPGINVKFQMHDNFIRILKEEGYQSMLKVIDDYFGFK